MVHLYLLPEWIQPLLFAMCLKTQILAEERHHVVLKTIGDFAGMRTGVQFETVRDAVFIEDIVQFLGVAPQAILVTNIDADFAIPAEVPDVLIDES